MSIFKRIVFCPWRMNSYLHSPNHVRCRCFFRNDLKQFYVVHKSGIGLDFVASLATESSDITICYASRDNKLSLLTYTHAQQTLLEAIVHCSFAQLKYEWIFSQDGRIKDMSIRVESSVVVNGNEVALLALWMAMLWPMGHTNAEL